MSDIAKMIAIAKKFGGGGSAPAEVVILPETEFPGGGMGTQIPITTPLSAMPTPGATAIVTWNGTEYDCTIAINTENGIAGYMMGNFEAMDAPYGGSNPDAPFVVILVPAGMGGEMYGVIMPTEDVDSITLSIVQVGGASADSGSGGGSGGTYCITMEIEFAGANDLTYTSKDKTYAEIKAACDAGALPYCKVNFNQDGTLVAVSIAHCMVIPHNKSTGFVFRIVYGLGQGFAFSIQADDSVLVALD